MTDILLAICSYRKYYIIQRYFLRETGNAAFSENIEAWPFGPVIPSVYYYFCGAGSMPITLCEIPHEDILNLISTKKQDIDHIVECKRMLNPWDLVAETHKPEGAWASVYKDGRGKREVIPVGKIRMLG